VVFGTNDRNFTKMWEPVFKQVFPLIASGLTVKEALLSYVYPGGLPNLTQERTENVASFKNGILTFKDGDAIKMPWKIFNDAESGEYYFSQRFVYCPDGILLKFD